MMIRTPISKVSRRSINIVSVVLLILGYAFLSARQHTINPEDNTIPTFTKLSQAAVQVVSPHPRSGERWLWNDAKATFYRLGIAFSIATAIAITIALLIGSFTWVEAFFEWPLSFFAKITPTGALAVFFVLFGTDTKMYIAMIVFGILPGMIQSIVIAVKQVSQDLVNKGYTLGCSTTESIIPLMFLHVLPNIIDAIKAAIGPAMIFLIAAEMLCADVGFGYRIRMQSRLLNMDIVYIYLCVLALFGFFADFVLKLAQNKFCPHYNKIAAK